MEAFLTGPIPPFRTPTFSPAHVCSRRTPIRSPPRVRVSATTDEAPPLSGPPTPIQPPRRPDPMKTPETPFAFAPSRPGSPNRPQRPLNDAEELKPPRDRFAGRPGGERLERPERFRPSDRGERGGDPGSFVPDPDATYYTTCGACKASYEINPEELGPRGRKVGCAVCGNEWFQRMDKLAVLNTDTEGMKPYPVEEKEQLMDEQARLRSERRGRRRDGERRERGDRREPREGGRRGRFDRDRGAGSPHSLFIGNLPFSLTKEELESILRPVVDFTRLSLVTDANMRSKGFAFADLRSAADVHKAVEQLDGRLIDGRAISVRVGRRN